MLMSEYHDFFILKYNIHKYGLGEARVNNMFEQCKCHKNVIKTTYFINSFDLWPFVNGQQHYQTIISTEPGLNKQSPF